MTHEPVVLRSLDMRYAGQNYERQVSIPDGPITRETIAELERRFAEQHKEFYGFALEGEPMEAVLAPRDARSAWRTARWPPSHQRRPTHPPSRPRARSPSVGTAICRTPIYRRETLPAGFIFTGPAIVEEPDSTTVIYPGDTCTVRADGMLDVELA